MSNRSTLSSAPQLASRPADRVAVLGAAFDPIHYGHCAMAALVLREMLADIVWLCPSPARWDKTPLAPPHHRLQWVEAAAEHLRSLALPVEACHLELALPEYRGSYFFLEMLAQTYPETEFSLVLGQDALGRILNWKDPVVGKTNGALLLSRFPLIIIPREVPGIPLAQTLNTLGQHLLEQGLQFKKQPVVLPSFASVQTPLLQTSMFIANGDLAKLSSTHIRQQIAALTHARSPIVTQIQIKNSETKELVSLNTPPIFQDIWDEILSSECYGT